jgi:hypothetical protein
MPAVLLTIIQGLISTAPAAISAWQALQPILASGKDPTPEQWAAIMPQILAAHRAVQATSA